MKAPGGWRVGRNLTGGGGKPKTRFHKLNADETNTKCGRWPIKQLMAPEYEARDDTQKCGICVRNGGST